MKPALLFAIIIAASGNASAQTIKWQWNNLDTLPQAVYDQAMRQNQGVVGMDALFPELSRVSPATVSVEKIILNRPTHYAIDGTKRAHTGILTEFSRMTAGLFDDDDDVLMFIYPNPGNRPYENYLAQGTTKARLVEGEIDVMDAVSASVFRYGPKPFSQFTGFGPWVHEKHNYFDTRPHDYLEIHPCENIWWSEIADEKMKYTLGVFSDNSGRFNDWRRNPVIALNAIAFEFQTHSKPLNYTMRVLDSLHMVPYPLFNDNATEHYLMDGEQVIAVIKEASSPNIFFSIDFARVSKTPIPRLPGDPPGPKFFYKGFMKIHSAVKDGGHSIFTVQENRGGISLGRRLSDITVTLRSIHCVTLDDEGSTEEIYGAYGVSAVTGLRPFHANVFTPGAANGTLWQRTKSSTLNLRRGQTSQINGVRTFVLPPTGELVIYGDLSEKDEQEGGDNDRLGESYLERIYVRDLSNGVPRLVTHTYMSGGSKFEVLLSIERKDRFPACLPCTNVIK